ncbi:MAG TPA: TonB-dependent receptor [Candidatus Sulfotelmatobacter sp.]|nr:TonB-dependent receptor [Candidatus Sulfotelmatobacter sp.]
MRIAPFCLSLFAFFCVTVSAQQGPDLTELSVDQLANIQVTSASRKAESLAGAPAAIYVLTGDAIREAGFTTLPEALRMVPSLYVVQTNSHSWQVSTRGFSGIDNRKMLVLVDGRSVYSPSFGGVFWDLEDIPIENIDRIEVIRGPGGTLWGENAVNGVINIITKSADQTEAVEISSSADINTGYTSFVQYGGRTGDIDYRVYGKASYWDPFTSSSGEVQRSSFGLPQGGMRADWTVSQKDSISIEGMDADGHYQGYTLLKDPVIQAELLKDSNVSIRWKHTISDRSRTEVLVYCDWYTHGAFPEEEQNTCYAEFQHDFTFNSRNSLIWGGSFETTGDASLDCFPQYRRFNDEGGFFQYEFVVVPDRLRVLAGSKFDGNPFTGVEYQPQARAVFTVNKTNLIWGAFSRALRPPSHSEVDLNTISGFAPSPNGTVSFTALGNPRLQSEHLKAYEIGYRLQASDALSVDLATYYNGYDDLIVFAPVTAPQPLEVLTVATNESAAGGGTAQTHGLEFSANWQPLRRWMISPNFTEIRGSVNAMTNIPKHAFGVQSRFDFARGLFLDAGLYHDNALAPSAAPIPGEAPAPGVPTFNRVDLGASWHPRSQWTFGVWGRNLQSEKHIEFVNDFFGGAPGEVPRSVSFKLMWQSNPEPK